MRIKNSDRLEGAQAEGEGMLCISDLRRFSGAGRFSDRNYDGFELSEGITDVEAGFFDCMPHLRHIVIASSVKHIGVTEKTKEIFDRNNSFVSGLFDSYAEQFAREQGICFVHENIELAAQGDFFERGRDIITLRLYADGSAELHQDCRCPGISAGSVGGGECDVRLPGDFYLTHSPKDIAELCWGSCYKAIVNCGKLKTFLNKAKKKKGFCLRFG
ncbi:MAG: hypothetical protein IKN17_05720 [Ruminococcus sp.]|nr:hypothetical protein [Ruminococcus sp.]